MKGSPVQKLTLGNRLLIANVLVQGTLLENCILCNNPKPSGQTTILSTSSSPASPARKCPIMAVKHGCLNVSGLVASNKTEIKRILTKWCVILCTHCLAIGTNHVNELHDRKNDGNVVSDDIANTGGCD